MQNNASPLYQNPYRWVDSPYQNPRKRSKRANSQPYSGLAKLFKKIGNK